jgi:hypothetical protein
MHRRSRSTLFFGAVLALTACGKEPVSEEVAQSLVRIPEVPAAKAAKSTLADLGWIIGSFRGTGTQGTIQEPFYERYSLVNDSALIVESFKDSTFKGAPDSTRYDLRGDSLTNIYAAATEVSPSSVTFISRKLPGLAWTWRKENDSAWTAIIVNTVPSGPPKTRVYRMVKLVRPK